MTETETVEQPATVDTGTPRLNAALAAVQRDLPRIDKGKTAKVPTKNGGEYTYSYADLADVAQAIKPLLGAHGLAFTTWPTLTGNRFVLRYELLHESGEQKDGEYPLPSPLDVGAQALGSAITYARRYCLCAVTGVAPDDDDDAAAADAKRQAEQAAEQAEYNRQREEATQSVMGAWANQFGGWDPAAAAQMFGTWSKGGDVKQASPAQLRAFTGYLLALPAADAGSTPTTEPEQPAADDAVRVLPDDRISNRQNGMLFALFEDLGWKNERQRQLEFLTSVTGRTIKSRSDLRPSDMDAVLTELEQRVAALPTSGDA